MLPNDRPPSDCLALAEQFDAKADAVAERSAEFEALDRTLNLLSVLAGNADADGAARDRTDRLAGALARMGDLLQELDSLDLHVAAAYLSMALDTARGAAPRLNG